MISRHLGQQHCLDFTADFGAFQFTREIRYYQPMLADCLEDCIGGVGLVDPALSPDEKPRWYSSEMVKSSGIGFYIRFPSFCAAQRTSNGWSFSQVFFGLFLFSGDRNPPETVCPHFGPRTSHTHVYFLYLLGIYFVCSRALVHRTWKEVEIMKAHCME